MTFFILPGLVLFWALQQSSSYVNLGWTRGDWREKHCLKQQSLRKERKENFLQCNKQLWIEQIGSFFCKLWVHRFNSLA